MRVLLFGVDGLTLRLIKPLMAQGYLPHFRRVYEEGAHALLRAPLPPLPATVWTSLVTGLPPTRHGVYEGSAHDLRLPSRREESHRPPALWQLLSAWGRRVIVANVPCTYPPEPLNGILVSGPPSPPLYPGVAYPPDFGMALMQTIPDYRIAPVSGRLVALLSDPLLEIRQLLQARTRLLRLLLQQPWDCCLLVFQEIDLLQHLYWDHVSDLNERIVGCYRLLDEALGLALTALAPGDLLMLVAPYSFQGIKRTFHLHEYLRRRGLLSAGAARQHLLLRGLRPSARQLKQIASDLLSPWTHIAPLARRLRRAALLAPARTAGQRGRPAPVDLLPDAGPLSGYATVVLDERLTESQIEELIIDLQALTDPETAYPAINEIYREERQVAPGEPAAALERRLLLLAHDHIALSSVLGRSRLWEAGDPLCGRHHPDGLLCLYGAGLKRAVLPPLCIYDILPTLLAALEVPIPPELNGRPLLGERAPLESLSQM